MANNQTYRFCNRTQPKRKENRNSRAVSREPAWIVPRRGPGTYPPARRQPPWFWLTDI